MWMGEFFGLIIVGCLILLCILFELVVWAISKVYKSKKQRKGEEDGRDSS